MIRAKTNLTAVMLGLLMLCALLPRAVAEPSPSTPAAEVIPLEDQTKAEFLFHFAKLTEWPENTFSGPEEPLVVGVLGADPFGAELEKLVASRRIHGRHIKIARFAKLSEVRCHLLFISSSKTGRLGVIMDYLADRPVLTVSDIDAFAERGGMIGLIQKGAAVRFQINLAPVKRAKLNMSSKLLKLAELVPASKPAKE